MSVHLYGINNLSKTLNSSGFNYTLNQENLDVLNNGLINYNNETSIKAAKLKSSEYLRNLFNILLCAFYVAAVLLSFLAYRKRWPKFILVLYIFLLISLPVIFIVDGFNAVYFLMYADLCEGVHGSIYENQTPIYNKGIGYLTSCFDKVNI